MGTSLAMFMKLRGAAHITIIDGLADRLDFARRIAKADRTIDFTRQNVDAELGEECFDLVVDAVGKSNILLEASGRVKQGGKVCSMGVLKSNDQLVDIGNFRNNACLHMLNFPYGEYDMLPELIQMVESGAVKPKDFYSHVVPFENIQKALQLVETRTALKVVLDISGCTSR